MTLLKTLELISAGSTGSRKLSPHFKAKSHWGKTGNFPHYANPVGIPRAAQLYPQLPEFTKYQRSMTRRHVPKRLLQSKRAGNATIRATKTYPGCALTYDCVCSADKHCATGQKCTDVPCPPTRQPKYVSIVINKLGYWGLWRRWLRISTNISSRSQFLFTWLQISYLTNATSQ